MKNLDLSLTNEELKTKMQEAVESGDNEKQVEALTELMQYIAQETTLEVTKTMRQTNNDNMIMTSRGAKLLTSEEIKYYNKLSEAMKTNQSISDIDVVMPTTVIDRIFEDLEAQHPLLSKINFQNVTGMVEIIVRTGDVTPAWWGKLTDEIKKELESGELVEIKVSSRPLKRSFGIAVQKKELLNNATLKLIDIIKNK